MKKQILTLALGTLFGLGAAVAAPFNPGAPQQQQEQAPAPQDGQHAGHRADPNQQVRRLSKRLNLTADQQNQLLPILTNQQQQMESIRNDSSLSPEDKHAKMRSLREDTTAKVRGLLTDEQKQTYDQMQQQMRERMQQRREQRQNGEQPNSSNS